MDSSAACSANLCQISWRVGLWLGWQGCDIMAGVSSFEELLHGLEGAGLWSDVTEVQKRGLIRALGAGEDVAWTAGGCWRADGEDLADGQVEEWLLGMVGPLGDCGVELRVDTVCDPFDEGSAGYSVAVNGTMLSLYAYGDGEPGVPAVEDPWMNCSIQPAAQVNRLLQAAGSSRRVALFWPGGNDGFSVLGKESVFRRAVEGAGASNPWECVIP